MPSGLRADPPKLCCPILAVMVLLGAPACDDTPTAPEPAAATFRVQACSTETFSLRLTEPRLIDQANGLIGRAEQPIVSGALARGSGGFNEPWGWHMVPASVEFADAATEVCDGCPHMVEEDLDYWVGTVGRFCPWTSQIVGRID